MDSKMYRYMQRLERIMTPTKTKSPHRPSKSPLTCKTNQLDQYLKYELAAKIINTLTIRNNNRLTAFSFNSLRNCDYQQKERIYKFVSIEKKDGGMNVDTSIAIKLFVASLNGIFKKQLDVFLEGLREGGEGVKENKRNSTRSARLMRTSSKPEKKNYVEISEWAEDAPTLNQRQNLMKQLKTLKSYAGKMLIKTIDSKRRKQLKKGLKSIKLYALSQSNRKYQQQLKQITDRIAMEELANQQWFSKCKMRQNGYIGDIENLNSKIMKDTTKTMTLSASTGQVIPTVTHEEEESMEWVKNNDELRVIGDRLFTKRKGVALKELNLLTKGMRFHKKEDKQFNQIGMGLILLDKFTQKYKKAGYKPIKTSYILATSQNKAKGQLLLCINRIQQKKRLHWTHLFFKNINPTKHLQVELDSNVLQLTSPSPITQKDQLRLTSRTTDQGRNSVMKNDFQIFVQKMEKMMTIFAKFPANNTHLAQAFVKIDKYSSFSDNLQKSLGSISQKSIAQAFSALKLTQNISKSPEKASQQLHLLQSVLKNHLNPLYIQAFSYIKIISKDREPKIEILPLKSSIITKTQQFISERNHEYDKSFITWKRLKLEMENPHEVGDLQKQIKQAKKRRKSSH